MDVLLLTHGAGSDCEAPLLRAAAAAFAATGAVVVRFNLPFRRARPSGPPGPADRARDVAGIREAVAAAREEFSPRRLWLGGHSYGGRLCSIAAAEQPALADALLLLGYPLHPPRRPTEARTAHFPALKIPAFFASGDRDPFGAPHEFAAAFRALTAPYLSARVVGAGHDLAVRGRRRRDATADPHAGTADAIAAAFRTFADEAAAGYVAGERVLGAAYADRPGAYVVARDAEGRCAVVETPEGVFLPGGGVDPGETPEDAARREFREECGLAARLTGRLAAGTEYAANRAGDELRRKPSVFFTAEAGERVGPGEADHRLRWLEPAAAYALLDHGGHRRAVALACAL